MKKILLLILMVFLLLSCQQKYDQGNIEIDINNDEIKVIRIYSSDGMLNLEINDESKKILDLLEKVKYEELLEDDLDNHLPIEEEYYTIGVDMLIGHYTFYLMNDKVLVIPFKQDETYDYLIATHEDIRTLVDEFNNLEFNSTPFKVGKPVIYIYPEEMMEVEIKIKPEEIITTSYPRYKGGWKITASPEGVLDYLNHQYAYLFWEGEIIHDFEFADGFIVKNEDTVPFLEEKLDILGLNFREKNDFITYWLPELEQYQYNKIRFLTSEVEDLVELDVHPQPDTLIRIYMIFEGLHVSEMLNEQELKSTKRTGYTVVEWGGMEIK
jgi:hypothetical protein